MAKKNIKTASLDDLDVMYERGELIHDPKAPIEPDIGSWDEAKIVMPSSKKSVHLRVDADVLEFFKHEGKGHLTRMNAVLRRYMEAHQSQ